MNGIGDKVRLPDGRHGTVVGVTVPIAAWKGANGNLMMERKNRELEVEVENDDGSRSRVFVREDDRRGPSLMMIAIGSIVVGLAMIAWVIFK